MYSRGGNVNAASKWRTSAYSGENGSCVEAADHPHGIAVRDTKNRSGGGLVFSPAAWNDMTNRISRELPDT